MDTQTVSNLVQGVSQQADAHRRDSQCIAQRNCVNSPLRGCEARPHFEIIAQFPATDLTNSFFHEVVRGEENYLMGIHDEAIFALNLSTGVVASATTAPTSYLDEIVGVPVRKQFRARTIEDTTFIVNRYIPPAMDSATSPAAVNEGFIFVRAPSYNGRYRVKLTSGANVAETIVYTPTASSGAVYEWLAKVDTIADFLVNGRAVAPNIDFDGSLGRAAYAGLHGTAGFTVVRYGAVLRVTRGDGAAFTIETEDGQGDTFMYAFKGFIQDFERLPKAGVPGTILEVQGEDRTRDDNYYVEFSGDQSTGSWLETIGPSVPTTIDPATMPHIMLYNGLNDFTFFEGTQWSGRIAGDEDTVPDPTIIGNNLRDIFWHKGRLGLLTEASIVWSKARFPYTFFPDTAQVVLADAPIDVRIVVSEGDTGGVIVPDFVVQINKSLFVWAKGQQMVIGAAANEGFKPDTVEADGDTALEYSDDCNPLRVGTFLFFVMEPGEWAVVRAAQYANGLMNGEPLDITSHVPSYIPAGVEAMSASDTLRTIALRTSGDTTKLWLYNWLFQENTFAQSAWNYWDLPGDDTCEVLWHGIRKNKLRVLQQRGSSVMLMEANLTPALTDPEDGATYLTRLDLRVTEADVTSMTYNPTTDRTTFTLPYVPLGEEVKVVGRANVFAGSVSPGEDPLISWRGFEYDVLDVTGSVVTVRGDLTGGAVEFYVGQRIVALRDEGEFYLRDDNGPVPVDRLTLDRFKVFFDDTAYTRIEVRNTVGEARVITKEFTGLLNSPQTNIGSVQPQSGNLETGIGLQAKHAQIRLINDTWLPSAWQSAAYMYEAVGWKGKK